MKISVVIHTILRPCLTEARNVVENCDELLLAVDDIHHRRELVTVVNETVRKTTGDIIVYLGEKHILKPNWKDLMFAGFNAIQSDGVVAFTTNNIVSMGAVSRSFYEHELGGNLLHPDYIHYCADLELGDVARRARKYKEVPAWHETKESGTIPVVSQSPKAIPYDEETYRIRTNAGWPKERLRTDEERRQWL